MEITASPDHLGEAFNNANFCLTFKYIMLDCQVVTVLIRVHNFFPSVFFGLGLLAPTPNFGILELDAMLCSPKDKTNN